MKHVWDKGNSIVCIDEDHMVRKAPRSVLFTVEWSWCCFETSQHWYWLEYCVASNEVMMLALILCGLMR